MRSKSVGTRGVVAIAAVFALGVAPIMPALAEDGDVLIQAGHEGRPASCAPLHVRACNLGTAGGGAHERDWTPIVADEATRVLREAGLRVIRRPADYRGHDRVVAAAVFLHFDGDDSPCGSGASLGYPDDTPAAFVAAWHDDYASWFPFRFMHDNFTENEHRYYGFRKVDAPAKMLIEFGEMTCPAQRAWLQPRLRALGDRLARFLLREVARR